jgi:hypothetical protein
MRIKCFLDIIDLSLKNECSPEENLEIGFGKIWVLNKFDDPEYIDEKHV